MKAQQDKIRNRKRNIWGEFKNRKRSGDSDDEDEFEPEVSYEA